LLLYNCKYFLIPVPFASLPPSLPPRSHDVAHYGFNQVSATASSVDNPFDFAFDSRSLFFRYARFLSYNFDAALTYSSRLFINSIFDTELTERLVLSIIWNIPEAVDPLALAN